MPKGQSRKHEGHYFVVVDGVPQHCQWQELKDYLRQSAKVRPGHTNVIKVNEDGTRVGFCPVASRFEANKAFDFLVAEGWRGLDIRVSVVWKSDLASQEVQRKRGPEPSRRRRMSTSHLLPHFYPTGNGSINNFYPFNFNTFSGVLPSRASSTTTAYPESTSKISSPLLTMLPHIYTMTPAQVQSVDASCAHDTTNELYSALLPDLEESRSRRKKEMPSLSRRTIHISRLSSDTTTSELKAVLVRYGSVSRIDLCRGRDKKCEATATYSRPTEAALAIRELDGRLIQKSQVVVRLDCGDESEPNSDSFLSVSRGSPPRETQSRSLMRSKEGPLVVNGAQGRKLMRNDNSSACGDLSSRCPGFQDNDSESTLGHLQDDEY